MKKWNSIQGLALTSALLALVGCEGDKQKSEMMSESYTPPSPIAGMLADQMHDSSMTNAEKMHMTATQLDMITTETIHGTLGGKNPPHVADGSGFIVTADFLWWKADEDNLDYAIKYKQKNPVAGSMFANEKIELGSTNGKWSPGFRVGVGGMFGDHDNWDIYLNWTRFNSQNKAHMRTKNSATQFVTALWVPQLLTGDFCSSAKQHWELNYNTLDLELGRDYFISADITARPHLGLRGAVIDQHIRARYTGGMTVPVGATTATFFDLQNRFKGDNDYSGLGMRTGVDFLWHFTQNVGLFGQLSAALLYGRFDVDQKVNTFQNTSTATVPSIAALKMKEHRNLWRTRSNIQGAVGVTFEELFHLGKYRFALSLAYEFLTWFQQNMLNTKSFANSINSTTFSTVSTATPQNLLPNQHVTTNVQMQNGDLGLQGFSGEIQLDF